MRMLLAVLMLATPAFAQIAPLEFGTKDESVYNINPSEFEADDPASRQGLGSSGVAVAVGFSSARLAGSIHLPAGVLLKSATIYYFDENAAADPDNASFWATGTGGGSFELATVTFPTGSPSGTSVTVNFPPNTRVNNDLNHYGFTVTLHAPAQLLYRVAIRYQREVSPAPGTATFSDVPPSHLFYQFIEALAASGITAGCSAPPNPNFCPDAPLTRGQMSVFLSRALGLHWVP
jgi:S-layer family protein